MLSSDNTPSEAPRKDWASALDLDRKTITKSFVDRMEECMRAQQTAADDLKEVIADAKEAEFSPRDVEAMKKIAKLRLKDQRGRAQEQLEALQRIGRAVGFDLFDWADAED
jgi:uncharacterized protein (UPF0335 family)